MYYTICKVIDLDGQEIGYIVHKEGTKKLEDTNLWTTDEQDSLREHVATLNNKIELQQHWPDAHDPEVVALID